MEPANSLWAKRDQGYTLRPYQASAVLAAVKFFRGPQRYNAIEVLPTGSGKSLIIATIAKELDAPVLIFQPTKEILEQNCAKYLSYGYHSGVYSASVGRKDISKVTFATIGSVKNKSDMFRGFPYIIVDECHFVNPKGGMYETFLSQLASRSKVLGLTATPYRLVTDGFGGSILKFLTRTRPRVFEELIYYVQNADLFQQGYLAKLKYVTADNFDRGRLQVNSTGADYTDESVKRYYKDSNFQDGIVSMVRHAIDDRGRKNALVFTRFTEEARYLVERIPDSAIVTAESSKTEREAIMGGFKSGRIKVVCNVGVLTTGFDYPELETIVLARPTMSLALYYQMIGRGIRPHPKKVYAEIIDLCGNRKLFGNIEDLMIIDGRNGKWFLTGTGGKQLTNIYYDEKGGIEEDHESMLKKQAERKKNAGRYGKTAWGGKRGYSGRRRS